MRTKQNVVIKGTKDGLTLHLNDRCSFDELLVELAEKMDVVGGQEHGSAIKVTVQAGNRYLLEEDIEVIKNLISQRRHLIVVGVKSNVMTMEEAVRWKEAGEIVSYTGRIRSGQVLEVPGDLLLIGDVNPGGTVKAGRNIFIVGLLKGIAHAGCYGDEQAVIAAGRMMPSQLRIAHYLNRAPDRYEEEESYEAECAYIDASNQIVIDRLQVLQHLRPDISTFKGGNYSG
ncbi:septum site-determining protein MinC [Bacillus thermotolerans]|uniref:Probable septum site-determining protein MinC n=1 Tax=Bacillus thermotolerans TaxID=1221996 RepID=A0A0F5HQI2_BACTR|nr:septum site-determining protein MinC [Bacillus thermotolerans]KKB35092.1 Septum site-determining protein MinC [Bacillus thermotolerans]KKB43408.1 Septum site-determining protein MinC [Bacillus thermotolerans]KKB43471.1 Septum site-determining protein MinC [Bacillus thermotolerans]